MLFSAPGKYAYIILRSREYTQFHSADSTNMQNTLRFILRSRENI
jgi:hypothetical protein